MFLNKVLTSHFWISEGGEAHNNMPKSIFTNNSINCCLREPSLEKNSLKSLHGFPRYGTTDNKLMTQQLNPLFYQEVKF